MPLWVIFRYIARQRNATHVARWGLGVCVIARAINMSQAGAMLVRWFIKMTNSIHCAPLHHNLHNGYGIRSMPTTLIHLSHQ